jgi:hypothetical protein
MTRPENTDVIANDSPLIVPTLPLARSRSSSGTSIVTHVESAIDRSCPDTDPSSVVPISAQNQGFVRRSSASASTVTNTSVASVNETTEMTVASAIASRLRWRST